MRQNIDKIKSNDILIFGWTQPIRFRIASKRNDFYDVIISILHKITNDYPMVTHNGYKDIIVNYSDDILWDYKDLTRENLLYVLNKYITNEEKFEVCYYRNPNPIILKGEVFNKSGVAVFEYDEPLINSDDPIEDYILSRKIKILDE